MKGQTWTAEEKLVIVMEGMKGTKPVAEICWEHYTTDQSGSPIAFLSD